VSPIQGFTRFRKHQVGVQTSFTSNATATRILPFRGPIVVEPNRTDPDVDVGSLDPILKPFNGPKEVTGTWEGKLAFDDAPYVWAATIKGGVSPTGGGTDKTWTFQAASLTADDFEYLTDEWGDDYSTDVIIGRGGVIDSLELGFDEDLSAYDVNADLVYSEATLCDDFTPALTIDASPQWVYGADTEVYLDSAFGSIGTTKLTDAVHGATLTINNNLDRKRFANGSNTRFQLAGYGRGPREIELQLVLAKTAATVAEACTLDDEPVPDRFIELRTTSPEIITGSIPYSQSIRLPMRLVGREDGEINNNSVITLTYRGFYSADLGYAIRVVVVNTLSSL
jgi:hypothetical protein